MQLRFLPRMYYACFALLLVSLLAACAGPSTPAASTATKSTQIVPIPCAAHSSQPVTLNMYYGSEKQKWIENVVADFNSRGMSACDGPITVKATPIGSGDSMRQILAGKIQPDVWSPAGSVWLTLLNNMWQQEHGSTIIPTGATDTPSLVTSPVVIAMWKPEAQALGWPNKLIGWSDIAALSTNPRGWAAYGHPEFGDFKFGHTHPDYSNSGLDAVIAENYAAISKVRGLNFNDVNNSKTKDFVANVESSIIHYGDSTGFFATKMFSGGPNYLSAAVMYESLVVEANEPSVYPQTPLPVVAIYPKEGTFYSDHPFAIPQASWVTTAKRTSALALRNFLLDKAQQQKAMQYGFRPSDLSIPLTAPLDSAHGIDTSQPKTLLQIPSAQVVSAIKASWDQQRRKVDVMLILDRSGSMNDTIGGISKIDAAKQGLTEFVNLLGDSDGLGLTVFSYGADVLTPVTALGPKRQSVLDTISGITAVGQTRLFDTIAERINALRAMPSKHIKAVIVLTDGMDNISKLSLNQLVQQISPAQQNKNAGEAVKVFTIAYGNDADVKGLTAIATAGGGQEYTGTPQNIRQVYSLISAFF
ncbi:MAG: VWA domain-containing protein [Ktedonobacteraceae bacterium]|nr:VWA domain-containing protein [Ktedonobacteraceae bacterium]